jgi:hypothetical protein
MAEKTTTYRNVARWWAGYWPRRVLTLAVNGTVIILILCGVHVSSIIFYVSGGLLLAHGVPPVFFIGALLLTYGVIFFSPTSWTPRSVWLELIFPAVVVLGITALWWDWRTAHNPRPIPDAEPTPQKPRGTEPEWARQLAGVIGVWWGAIFGAILIVLYLVLGPFDSR